MPESVNIQVGGNVSGSIVVGDANFVVNTNYGSIVYQQARPEVRLRAFAPQAPRPSRGFVNRKAELDKIAAWISSNEIVLVHAADGMGKSALLRQAANLPAAKSLQNGIVFLENLETHGEAWGTDDVVQKLFEALFESEPPLKVDNVSGRTYLSNTRALVLLDEIPLSPELQHILPDLFPQGVMLVAEDIPVGADYQRLPVGPLPRQESINLLMSRAEGSVNDTQRPIVNTLCALLQDISLAIIITANIIHATGLSPEEALIRLNALHVDSAEPVSATLDRVYRFAFSCLNPTEKKVISIAAQTPGVSMSPEWLTTALGVNAEQAIERLMAMGLLFANSPRLRMPPGFLSAARRISVVDEASVLGRLVDYLLAGASNGIDFVDEEIGNLFGALQWAVRTGRPRDVIALGRALDAHVCLHGLWDRWEQILNLTLEAARQTQNHAVEAWAYHQLGTREIGAGTRQRALDYLRQALDIRRELGDSVGVAFTQHNIDYLIGPPTAPRRETKPDSPDPSGGILRTLLLVGGLGLVGMVIMGILIGIAAQVFGVRILQTPIPPLVATLTTVPVTEPAVPTLTPAPTLTEVITQTPSASWTPSITPTPTAPGGSGEIAYQNAYSSDAAKREPYSVYSLDLRGFDPKKISIEPFTSILEPAWSPDGTHLAFTARNDSNYSDIFVANPDGSDWVQITSTYNEQFVGNKSHASWSPDGKRIAFVYTDSDNVGSNLYSVDSDGSGSNLKNLTNNQNSSGHFDYPEWSPDGKRIAYQAEVDGRWEVFVMDADGSNQTRLTFSQERNQWNGQPSWSPDSKQLAFASNRKGNWDIYVMDRKGAAVTALTQDDFNNYMPDWSPDGQLIAFSSNRADIFQIFQMTIDGSDIKPMTNMETDTSEVDWRPR